MKFFAVSDNRVIKARKIEAVLCDYLAVVRIAERKILDLGCGSGHIAEFFSHDNDVVAADVINQITINTPDSLKFVKICGSVLPFENDTFDIVIFNHAFYCMADQVRQLLEIHRVLRAKGICYFASANRYFPIEGFTKIPLVHYLPSRLFQILYKKIRNTDANLYPVGYFRMIAVIKKAGFDLFGYTGKIIDNPAKYHCDISIPLNIPVPIFLSPTVVFVLSKTNTCV